MRHFVRGILSLLAYYAFAFFFAWMITGGRSVFSAPGEDFMNLVFLNFRTLEFYGLHSMNFPLMFLVIIRWLILLYFYNKDTNDVFNHFILTMHRYGTFQKFLRQSLGTGLQRCGLFLGADAMALSSMLFIAFGIEGVYAQGGATILLLLKNHALCALIAWSLTLASIKGDYEKYFPLTVTSIALILCGDFLFSTKVLVFGGDLTSEFGIIFGIVTIFALVWVITMTFRKKLLE